ncbi:septum formation initiator family protein [Myxococcota bacterium]|nr:septum formation initiator family protein [Myxococcota bacterium]
MNALLARRLVMTIVPFVLMGSVVLMAIFGDHGLVRRHELRAQIGETELRLAEIERENAALRRQIRAMDKDRIGVQRLAAQELLVAPPGSTIYRFETE